MKMPKVQLTLSHVLMGSRFDNWVKLLRSNPVTKEHYPQAALISVVSLLLYPLALLESFLFYLPIHSTRLKKDPVYIVGYWRSGTTYLQNLMTRDPQFAWFDPVNTVTFNNSILLGPVLRKMMNRFLVGARPMDNMEYTQDLPMEEVFAQATISTQAIAHMLVFPDEGRGVKYIETAFIGEQDKKTRLEWRRAYSYILTKVTWLKKGKQLVLKSPENTCRCGAIKRCYPRAKFINIYRNPYRVIRSTINMFEKEMDLFCLSERASEKVIEDVTINLFKRMYKKAIRELEAMPAGDHIDICYEDFCKDPQGHMQRIYQELGIEGYEAAKPYFDEYIESQKDYQKNQFDLKPELRDHINRELGFYFRHYGYEMVTE